MVVNSTQLALRPTKRTKKNATAKQLRARKKARAAARAACTPLILVHLPALSENVEKPSKAAEVGVEAAEARSVGMEASEAVPMSPSGVPVVSETTVAPNEPTNYVVECISVVGDAAAAKEAPVEVAKSATDAPVVPATLPNVTATVPRVTATVPEATATLPAVTATVPVAITGDGCARVARKKTGRASQLASFIRTLEDEDEEEEYRTFAAKSQAGGTKRVTTSDTSGARAAVTDSTVSDTNDDSSDTDGHSDGSNESDMYWRIYGKYYERSKLTVTANFASTKQTWNVARINDRRGDSLMTYHYQVLWVNTSVKKRRYYQRTWEPHAQLLADDFRQEIELVDRWKSSEVKTFAAFWPTDEYGKNAIGADMQGLCVFNALKRAAELCGRPDIVTQRDIDDFVADQLASRGMDMTKGTSWEVVLVFLRRLRDSGHDFIYRAIALDNFAVAGRRGVRVLNEIPLKDGVYVVAAYNHRNVGHACVLVVQGKTRLVYDLDKGEPIESAEDWIDFYAVVRPFIVCKQK